MEFRDDLAATVRNVRETSEQLAESVVKRVGALR
jgi:hypothetical protein